VSRSLLFVILGVVLLVGVLGALDVIPMGFGKGGGGDDGARDVDLLDAEGATDGEGTLKGRGVKGVPGEAAAEDAAISIVPAVPSEVRGGTPGGGVVRGRVVRGEGTIPLAGVKVVLSRPDSIIAYLRAEANGRYDVLEANTGADGRFAFLDVTPSQGYVVRAHMEGFAVASAEDDIDLRGRETVDVGDLAMGPGGGLTGRVLDAGQAPVAGARVVATWRISNPLGVILSDPDTAPELEAEAVTDAEGRYTLTTLDPAPKTLFAVAPTGAAEIVRSVTVEPGQVKQVDDIVLPGNGAIAGRVQWADGTPIAGARVFGSPMANLAATRGTLSDAAGQFRVEWLPGERPLAVGVLVPGMPVQMVQGVEVGRDDIVVEFPMPGGLRGRVRRAAGGAPVPRFFIQLEAAKQEEDWMMKMLRAQVQRGLGPAPFVSPEGAFEIPRVAEGTYAVVVTAPGFPEVRRASVQVIAGETVDVVVEVPEGNVARGSVVRADGSPVSGARLFVFPGGVKGLKDEALQGAVEDREPDAASRGDGSFELPPQTPGTVAVIATHPDTLPGIVRVVDLRAGDAEDVEIRLPPSGGVQGRLLDEHARPVKGGEEVYILFPDGLVETAPVDEEGRFELKGLRVGRCVVRWMSMRDSSKYAAIIGRGAPEQKRKAYDDLRQDGGEHEITDGGMVQVTLSMPRRVKVSGRLLVAGVPEPKPRGVWLQMPGAHTWWRVEIDQDAHYERELEYGHYQVWVQLAERDWRTIEIDIPDGPVYQLDLDFK
jgi:hypothetical protein